MSEGAFTPAPANTDVLAYAPTENDRRLAEQVLGDHPELVADIVRAIEESQRFFPVNEVLLEWSGYEDGDPLLTVQLSVPLPYEEFWTRRQAFWGWLNAYDVYNGELLDVLAVNSSAGSGE